MHDVEQSQVKSQVDSQVRTFSWTNLASELTIAESIVDEVPDIISRTWQALYSKRFSEHGVDSGKTEPLNTYERVYVLLWR
jgi:hypothetical protein